MDKNAAKDGFLQILNWETWVVFSLMQHSMTQVYTNKLGETVLTTDPLNDEAKLSLIHNCVIFSGYFFG